MNSKISTGTGNSNPENKDNFPFPNPLKVSLVILMVRDSVNNFAIPLIKLMVPNVTTKGGNPK